MCLQLTDVSPLWIDWKQTTLKWCIYHLGALESYSFSDITVNQIYEVELKCQFTHWYAAEIKKGLRGGNEVERIKVDFHLSTIKPIHAKLLMDVHTCHHMGKVRYMDLRRVEFFLLFSVVWSVC